jgi:tetratricopeptide (TPR) repeat protein
MNPATEAALAWDRQATRARRRHDFGAAAEAYDQALAAAAEAGDRRLLAASLWKAGRFRLRVGRIQRALEAFESGLRALAGGDPELARQLDALRNTVKRIEPTFTVSRSLDLGEEDVAGGRVDYARPLGELAADVLLEAELLAAAGDGYHRMGQLAVALSRYGQADRLARAFAGAPDGDVSALRGRIAANRALALRSQGRARAAAREANRAIGWLSADGDRTPARRAIATRAALARDAGERLAARRPQQARRRFAESEQLFQEAIALAEAAGDALGQARASSNLALLYLLQARWAEAEAACREALELTMDLGDPETAWHAGWGLGRSLLAQGRLAEAAGVLRSALEAIEGQAGELCTEEGRLTFREARRGAYDTLVEVHARRGAAGEPGAWAEALAASEEAKGRVLSDLLRGLGRRRPWPPWRPQPASEPSSTPLPDAGPGPVEGEAPPMAQSALGREVEPPALDVRQMAPGRPLGGDGLSDEALVGGAAAQGKEAGGRYLPTGEAPEPVARADAVLPPLSRLAFHVLPSVTAVFFVPAEGDVEGRLVPAGAAELATAVAALRRGLRTEGVRGLRGARLAGSVRGAVPDEAGGPAGAVPDAEPAEPPGAALARLHDLLVAPFAERLPEALVLEPDGPLWQLPFAALAPEGGAPLVERVALLMAPSLDVLDEVRSAPDYGEVGELPALLVGNPAMPRLRDLMLDPLAGAAMEVQDIQGLLGPRPGVATQVLTAVAAGKRQVLAAMASHGILHLATHGLTLAGDPMASFVVLADDSAAPPPATSRPEGCLLTARELAELALPADLVVLSACQTGLGAITGDGVIGLSRALLVAGARSVVVSLWNVDDAATAALMRAFYAAYRASDDKAAALAEAMRQVRARPETADPRFWAGFMLLGAAR